MARLFTDGAEFGDMLFWSAYNGTGVTATARTGSYAYSPAGSSGSHYSHKSFTASSEIYLRYGIYLPSTNLSTMMAIRNTNNDLLNMLYNGGNFQWRVGGFNGSILFQNSINIGTGAWKLLEVHYKIHDSTGIVEVKVDGLSAGSYSGDTKPGGDTQVNLLRFETNYSTAFYVDDMALNNTDNSDGKNDISWCGDGHIELLRDNGNSPDTWTDQWTGSDGNSTDNYALVDDIPPSSSDYIESDVVGYQDRHAIANWSGTGKRIKRVWSEARALDTSAGGNNMKIGLRLASADYLSAAIALGSSYGVVKGTEYVNNPATSAAWSNGELDAAQILVEVAA